MDELDRELTGLGADPTPDTSPEPVPEWDLEKEIDRRIRRICLKTIAVAAALAVLIFLGISPLMKQYGHNPARMEGEEMGLTRYLRAYYETMQPYTEVVDAGEIQDLGFGRYLVGVTVNNHLGENWGAAQLAVDRDGARTQQDPLGLLNHTLNRFECPRNGREDILTQLRQLPQSAWVALSVGQEQPVALKALLNAPVTVDWVELYHPQGKFQPGLSLDLRARFTQADQRGELEVEELRRQLIANLELLLEQPKLLTSLGIFIPSGIYYDTQALEQTLEWARGGGALEVKHYCIQGTRDQVVDYLEGVEPDSLLVDHVGLSLLAR